MVPQPKSIFEDVQYSIDRLSIPMWNHMVPQLRCALSEAMKKSNRQVRLMIGSNAGGSGKTTTTAHIACAVAQSGYKVTIVELDYSGSLSTFTGLPMHPPADESAAHILQKGFKGNYPLQPVWTEHVSGVTVIQGGNSLGRSIREVHIDGRGFYALRDRLEDYPLEADLVIFDTPASLEPMGAVALIASTHLLSAIKPECKDSEGFAGFLQWYYEKIEEFRLTPQPEILGFVPTRVDWSGVGTHRDLLGVDRQGNLRTDIDLSGTLPYLIEHEFNIHCFPAIRESNHYLKACYKRLPLQIYRPKCDYSKDFDPIATALIDLITA